jgi:hypothetical protein
MLQGAFSLTRLEGLRHRRKPLIRTGGNWNKIQTRELVSADQYLVTLGRLTQRDSRSRTNGSNWSHTLLRALYTLSSRERFYCVTSYLTEKPSKLRSFDRQ